MSNLRKKWKLVLGLVVVVVVVTVAVMVAWAMMGNDLGSLVISSSGTIENP